MGGSLVFYCLDTETSGAHAAVAALSEALPSTTVTSASLVADTRRQTGQPAPSLIIIDGSVDFALAIAECARLNTLEPDLPVVLIVPQAEVKSSATKRSGAAELVCAPIHPRKLVEVASKFIGGPASGTMRAASITHLGKQVILDRTGRRLWIAGEEQALSSQKFELLRYFADHPGKAIDARELVRAGLLRPTQAQRYRALIMELRERLGPARCLLRVVPGYGYRLDPLEANAGELLPPADHTGANGRLRSSG
jgi:DNA-binding response OmpR family regulator